MKVGALFTGGKDSTYSAFLAGKENEVVCLMNMYSENKDSYMFHTVGDKLLEMQAGALSIPLERHKTEGVKEEELLDLRDFISDIKERYGIEGIVSGALASEYQYNRINAILEGLKLASITPLWHVDIEKYLNDLIKNGFHAMIVSVSADGLDESWLGKEIDSENLAKLINLSRKYRFNLGFEGGEAETAVLDGPNFKYRIKIEKSSIVRDKGKAYLNIEKAVKVEKES
ncbi:MAG: diphthine--ammonia ligase [Candidatus Parvarchaeota archaeon]|jgi:ABC transporter with metal-binding/Fe-S-binding domain ATP-binding protein|nr:diphthine--ammonia ligase [Candidatus Parvarchaeota archaeon]MCL5106617.1 diphthine--ammonia ligase [Candidatus Parvarchaeota archaeon]